MNDRRYLDVPYKDKRKAKKVGAIWDSLTKLWYVPMHVPLQMVEQWLIKKPVGGAV